MFSFSFEESLVFTVYLYLFVSIFFWIYVTVSMKTTKLLQYLFLIWFIVLWHSIQFYRNYLAKKEFLTTKVVRPNPSSSSSFLSTTENSKKEDVAEVATLTILEEEPTTKTTFMEENAKTGSKIESMIEFVFKQSDNEVVGSGRNQMMVSHTSPLVLALNEHLISLDSTRCLLLHRNGPFSIASRDEIVVDENDQIFARVLPLTNHSAVDELRLWVEKRKEIVNENDLPKSGGIFGGGSAASSSDATDCIIFLYSLKLKLSDLNKFVRKIYEKDQQRKNDQLGNQLFYFKEVGSAMMAAEQQSIRTLANQQIKSSLLSSSSSPVGGGSALLGSSADGVAHALKLQSTGSSMLQQHMGNLGQGNGSGGFNHRPFMFMMTPFRTNKRIENLAGSVFRHIERRIKDFTENKAWWIKRGQPHTYGILVKGPPGCGKTSLTKAIAKSTNRNIFDMQIHPGVTQRQMFDFFHDDIIFVQQRFTGMILDGNNRGQDSTYRIPMSRRLLVFDDFTAGTNIFEDRESLASRLNSRYSSNPFNNTITNGNDPVTLQFALNLWDGVLENEDRITIFSDNYDNIDRAMKRPGRIDDIVEMGYITYDGMIDFLVMFFEIQDVKVLHDLFESYESHGTPFEPKVLTAAELNRILMTNREEKLEVVVHAVVGESIRFRDLYNESGDTYYRRIREQQDMDELFPPMETDDQAAEKEEEEKEMEKVTDDIEIPACIKEPSPEQQDKEEPVKTQDANVMITTEEVIVQEKEKEKTSVLLGSNSGSYDERKKRRRELMEEQQRNYHDEMQKRQRVLEQEQREMLEKIQEEDRLKTLELNKMVETLSTESKGISNLFKKHQKVEETPETMSSPEKIVQPTTTKTSSKKVNSKTTLLSATLPSS